ncbi:hypothetical protein [Kribbella sp. NPDC006257]|uniref:hypothetical protein n=1 Tax=Kribbella sp. NPDC006257 TaxID=3156738 RepID=UPI0033B32B89
MDHETPSTPTSTSERRAQADWLIAELRRRATLADAADQHDLRRSADSLVRLATALRG